MKKTIAGDTSSFKPVNRSHFGTERMGSDMGPDQQMGLPKRPQGYTTPGIPATTDKTSATGPDGKPGKPWNWNKNRPKGGK